MLLRVFFALSLLLPASAFAQVSGVTLQPGGGGIQYGTQNKWAFGGGSDTVIASAHFSTGSAVSCNGVICTYTDSVARSIGQHIQWPSLGGGVTAATPTCLNFAEVTITGNPSGTTYTFNEADTIVPGFSGSGNGCTGVVSGSGGTVQNAMNLYPFQTCRRPFFTHGGTITPQCINWGWPGDTWANANANYTARWHSLCASGGWTVVTAWGGNDIAGGDPAATIEGNISGWIGKARTDGCRVVLQTITGGPVYNSITATNNPVFDLVNDWIRSQECTVLNSSTDPCADVVVDSGSFLNGMTGNFVQGNTDAYPGHYKDAAAALNADILNNALSTQSNVNTNGFAGLGGNDFFATQTAPNFATPDGVINLGQNGAHGDGFLNFYSFVGTKVVFDWQKMLCFNNSSILPYGGNGNNCIGASNLGAGITSINPGGGASAGTDTGGLAYGVLYPFGSTSNPTFLRDGQMWYRTDLHQPCYNNNGTAACGWGAGGGFPITLGSTSIAANSTTTSISGLTLVSPVLSGTPDASGATQFKLPVAASFATLANGEQGYDTSNKNWHVWANGADNFMALFPAGTPPTNGDCTQFVLTSGVWTLGDAGAPCGGSGGPPTGSAGGDLNGTYPNPGTAKLAGTAAATVKTRDFGTTFGDTGGSALTAGSVVYFTVPYACTIAAWNMAVDAGTATIDIWKIATGTAIPTVTNTITASALPAISSGTAIHSTTLTGWTTSVAANDIFGIKLQTVATAKYVEIDVQCNQ